MIRVDGVFDIETEDWDRFVLGGVLTSSGEYREFRSGAKMVEFLLTIGGHIWTWNGGLFDSLWFAQELRRLGLRFSCSMAGTRIIRLECEGLVIRDAVALIPMRLQKAARIAGIELTKDTGLDCHCGNDCGGYCAISRAMPEQNYEKLGRYLRLDCEASFAVLEAIIVEAERCNYNLTGTVGGTSYGTFSKMAGVESAKWADAQTYKAARAGYYGGRVEVFRPNADRGFCYDINSAYPAALVNCPLPVGPMLRCSGPKARRAFAREKEGIFVARVCVPTDMFVPPLPCRTPLGRIIYPVGAFVGSWSALELREAEERGVDIQIDSGLVWSDAEPVLAGALQHGWDCRARAKAEGRIELSQWHKWVCNSATGKLAEAPEKERVIVNPDDSEVKACSCKFRPSKPSDCRCGAWRPLDGDGEIWSAPFWRISTCAHVHWAAYLTAYARKTLLEQLEDDSQSGKTAVYCDTDSCFATKARTKNIGPELGAWGSDGGFRDFHALAPKVYRYTKDDGTIVVRGKGLPGLSPEGFEAFAHGEPIAVERGVMGFRSAARTKPSLFVKKGFHRTNHADGIHFGGRRLGADGLTYPREYAEFVAWEKSQAKNRHRKNQTREQVPF